MGGHWLFCGGLWVLWGGAVDTQGDDLRDTHSGEGPHFFCLPSRAVLLHDGVAGR